MEIKDLKDRISKKESQIAKIEKRIAKWESAKSDKAFTKRYAWDEKDGKWWNRQTGEYDLSYEDFKNINFSEYCTSCDKEIQYATRDLEDAKIQLTKYNNALAVLEEKERTPKIQIIVDFLNNWKEDAKDYVRDNMKYLIDYYRVNKESCDFHNRKYVFLETMSVEEYKEKYKEYELEQRRLRAMIHPWTDECYSYCEGSHINEERLQELVDKEAENKYWDLIEKVTEKAGEITDIRGLTIGGRGDLNGYVIGTKNKVHVETIVAGGYNAGIIVNVKRGPIAHYRTIINVVK